MRVVGVQAREAGDELADDVIVAVRGEGTRYRAVDDGPDGPGSPPTSRETRGDRIGPARRPTQ